MAPAITGQAVPALSASHLQSTDEDAATSVESSRFEMPTLRHQAEFGDDTAEFALGMVYETGHGVPQSCVTATEWVTRAAQAGNVAAQYNLGLRYLDGNGVTTNLAEAEKWLLRAAK
jgi:TPR repeat protein